MWRTKCHYEQRETVSQGMGEGAKQCAMIRPGGARLVWAKTIR